ncbi:MAG TPA: Ig-like domain-containing protein, partial [Thermoanaerobaculia bacterium]|nr:Ig-like domain-containing protein [Thermoanaerobaculia bacterium]
MKLARIRISLDGQTIESATSPATLVWLAPPVTTSSTVEVSVEATDLTGNRATGTRAITVIPRVDTVPPTVAIDCPSSGAILPSGYGNFILQSTASDDIGVHRVEVYREGETTPFATAYAAAGSVKTYASRTPAITLPSVSEPTPVRFRVRAVDFGGNVSAEAQTEISVVPASKFVATGPVNWSTLVNETVYLESGTLVIDEPVVLGGLLIMGGASVTHSAGGGGSLDLTVGGPLFVDCGGSIEVSGRGYLAKASYP